VYLDPTEEPTGLRGWVNHRTPYFWLYGICSVVFGIFIIINLPDLMRPYSTIHQRAAPYVWSPQCPERRIQEGDIIELACAREEYRFKDDTKKLLGYGRSKTPYYRIGNNLIPLSCFRNGCRVEYVKRNAYYQ
jgi:hypothetical protein